MLLVTDKKYRYLVDNNNSGIVPSILSEQTYNERKDELVVLYDFETIYTVCRYDEYTDSVSFICNCKDEVVANKIAEEYSKLHKNDRYGVIKNKLINKV